MRSASIRQVQKAFLHVGGTHAEGERSGSGSDQVQTGQFVVPMGRSELQNRWKLNYVGISNERHSYSHENESRESRTVNEHDSRADIHCLRSEVLRKAAL
jgi:hypothetical protein